MYPARDSFDGAVVFVSLFAASCSARQLCEGGAARPGQAPGRPKPAQLKMFGEK